MIIIPTDIKRGQTFHSGHSKLLNFKFTMSSNLKLRLQTQEDLDQLDGDHEGHYFDPDHHLNPGLDLLTTATATILRSGTIVSTEEKRLTLAYEGLIRLPTHLLADYGPIIEVLDLSHNSIS